jgi:hypothetical protein
MNLEEIGATSHDPLSWWAGQVTATAERLRIISKAALCHVISLLFVY